MRKTYLVEVTINTGDGNDGINLPNSTARNILRNRINGTIKQDKLIGHFPSGITISVEEINVKGDPYVTDQTRKYEEMEADLKLANQRVSLRDRTIEAQERQFKQNQAHIDQKISIVTDLQDKNRIQVEIIDRQAKHIVDLLASNDRLRHAAAANEGVEEVRQDVAAVRLSQLRTDAYQRGYNAGNQRRQVGTDESGNPYPGGDQARLAWDEGYQYNLGQSFADGVTEGERRLHGLGGVGYETGFIEGKDAGIKEVHDEYAADPIHVIEIARADARREGYEVGLVEAGTHGVEAANDARKEGFESGHREGFDKGLAEGLEAPMGDTNQYKVGYEEGRQRALEDWTMHFILYMQQSGEDDFAVVKLSQLEDMREAAQRIREVFDEGGQPSTALVKIESILSGLEHL